VALELRGITKRFPGVVANDDVSLSVAPGEILALLGENGAGKTTLMNVLFGLYSPDEGEVVIDGEPLELSNPSASIAAGIGMVHQHFMLVPVFTVAENVVLGLEPTKGLSWIDKRAASAMVSDVSDRYRLAVDPDAMVGDIPVGVQQRVEIIKVLVRNARYIIFDEPTTALDVTTQIEVLAAIKDVVHQFNTAAIYITHDLAVVAQMADRIMVLRYGELVEEAPTRKMLSQPEQAYTKSLWAVRSLQKAEEAGPDLLLRVNAVDASYGGKVKVLENVTVFVPRGRTVAVVGESGSGKSTLARVITGLLPPQTGDIVFDGQTLPPSFKSRPRELLRRMQMIYQMPDTALNPRRRVRDIIGRALEHHLGLKGASRDKRAAEILDMVEAPLALRIVRGPLGFALRLAESLGLFAAPAAGESYGSQTIIDEPDPAGFSKDPKANPGEDEPAQHQGEAYQDGANVGNEPLTGMN